MAKLTPYLRFNGNCKEAMNFYKEIFGGELFLQTIGESPVAKSMPAEKHGLIMHAYLESGDIAFGASDMMRDKMVVGDNVALTLDCKSEEEIQSLFEKLSQGGEVFMPLEEAFWGATFGVLTDKFGFEWMLNHSKK